MSRIALLGLVLVISGLLVLSGHLRPANNPLEGPQSGAVELEHLGRSGRAEDVLLLGDSHAQALVASLHALLDEQGLSGRNLATTNCAYFVSMTQDNDRYNCLEYNQQVFEQVRASDALVIVLFARYTRLIEGSQYVDHRGRVEASMRFEDPRQLAPYLDPVTREPLSPASRVDRLMVDLTRLIGQDRHLIIVGPMPEFSLPPYLTYLADHRAGVADPQPLAEPLERYRSRHRRWQEALEEMTRSNPGISWLAVEPLFCDDTSGCVSYRDGNWYYLDDDHPSRAATDVVVSSLRTLLVGKVADRDS